LGGRDYQDHDRLKRDFAGSWRDNLRADIFKTLSRGIHPGKVRILEFYCAAPDGEGL